MSRLSSVAPHAVYTFYYTYTTLYGLRLYSK